LRRSQAGASSVGRASPSHGGGQRFESASAYQCKPLTPLRLARHIETQGGSLDIQDEIIERVFNELRSTIAETFVRVANEVLSRERDQ
jgi:hypothetical protein